MKNKPADIPYCGVDKEKIDNASPVLNEEVLRYHHLYLTERHKIYKKKEIEKSPKPWTEDKVLRDYRFTNVRRELDKESRWLIENISENDKLTLEEKILNSILFRSYNKSTTSELINQPIKNLDNLDDETISLYRNIFNQKAKTDPNYVFFTGAFMTGGLKKGNAFIDPPYVRSVATLITPKGNKELPYIEARDICNEHEDYDIMGWEKNIPTRMFRLIQKFVRCGGLDMIMNSDTQDDVYNALLTINGFSKFLGYQVFVDLTYIPEFKFSENEFSVSGPGCSAGLDMLFEDKDGMSYEECLFWVRNNIEFVWDSYGLEYDPKDLFDHLPEYDRCLNIMMIENSFCETQKIVKSKRDTGRPRKKYIGVGDPKKNLTEELF